MCEHGIACALRWGVAPIEVYSVERSSPFIGPPAGGRRSLEAISVKKASCGFITHFCKEAWNKLVLACILYKTNIKIFWDNLVLICDICKSVVIKFLRTTVISSVCFIVWVSGPG